MQNLNFYVGTPLVKVPEPFGWEGFTAELSFENDSPDAILNSSTLQWYGDQATLMNTWFNQGMFGGVGIFEGMPLRITVCGSQDILFDGIIDFTDPTTIWNCDEVKVKILDINIDRFNALASSVSFGYLATPAFDSSGSPLGGPPENIGATSNYFINPRVRNTTNILYGSTTGASNLTTGDYIPILYQNHNPTDYFELMNSAIAIFNMVDKIYVATNSLVSQITVVAAGLAALSVGAAVLAIIMVIATILYLLFLLLILYELIQALWYMLVSPVYQKLGMFARDLFSSACKYFGFKFQSTIFASNSPYYNTVIMPNKQAWAANNTLTVTNFMQHAIAVMGAGSSSFTKRQQYDDVVNLNANLNKPFVGAYGYYDGTVADFIKSMEDVFNAKAKIIRNASGQPEMHFERWDHQYNQTNYTLPNISDQAPFPQSYGTNASMVPANYVLAFATDTSDEHTLNNFEGTSCYCTTRPKTYSSPNAVYNVTLQGLTEKNLEFAHATRKEKLTDTENFLRQAFTGLNTLFNVVAAPYHAAFNLLSKLPKKLRPAFVANGPIPSPTAPKYIIGQMYLTNHVTTQPKIFIAGQPATTQADPFFEPRFVNGVTVDPNDRSLASPGPAYMRASSLFRDFHFSSLGLTHAPNAPWNSPYPAGAPYFNQYLMYKAQQITICCSEYNDIKNNNVIRTFDGKLARVDSIRWNIFTGIADIDYRVQQQYTTNLSTTFVIDGVTQQSVL